MANALRPCAVCVRRQFEDDAMTLGDATAAAAEIGRTVEVARGVDRETVLGVRSVGTDGAAHGERVDDGLRYAPAWQKPGLWLEPGRS
jgi:hypothetical protein